MMNKELLQMQQAVYARRPVLREIAKKYSDLSLKDYVQKQWSLPLNKPEKVFINVLKSEIVKLYGKSVGADIIEQIQKKALVSTTDHLGIWGHPIFVNAALIFSLFFKKSEFIPVLATESVSLNNTSSWSGSILVHKNNRELERYSFFPDRLKTLPVFSAPPLGVQDLKRFEIKTKGRLAGFADSWGFASVQQENFSYQACIISGRIWQAVFPSAPRLLYLPLETIVGKYLLKVFENPQHVFSQIIFTKQGRRLWKKYFGNEHTFMFWAIDKNGRRQAISNLSEDKRGIISLIQNRQIYASSPLCFAVLLHAGIACAGGFTQTTWLTQIKEKLVNLYSDLNLKSKLIAGMPTKNFTESSLAWLKKPDGYISPSAVDLYFTGKDYYPNYVNLASGLLFGQSLKMAMPEIYKVLVPVSKSSMTAALETTTQLLPDESTVLKKYGI